MKQANKILGLLAVAVSASSTAVAQADVQFHQGFPWQGLSMFTIVMALLYAGHLAQDRSSLGWRIVLFVLGFPLTFVVSFLVYPGSHRVLGVDLPRHEPSVDAAQGDRRENEQERKERKAAWEGVIALLVGISLVLLFSPSTQFRSEPIGDARYAIEKTVSWGWGESRWLSYERTGVQHRNSSGEWLDPEWDGERRWRFDASLEALMTLAALLVVFLLCLRDEVDRKRSAASDPPQRAA